MLELFLEFVALVIAIFVPMQREQMSRFFSCIESVFLKQKLNRVGIRKGQVFLPTFRQPFIDYWMSFPLTLNLVKIPPPHTSTKVISSSDFSFLLACVFMGAPGRSYKRQLEHSPNVTEHWIFCSSILSTVSKQDPAIKEHFSYYVHFTTLSIVISW